MAAFEVIGCELVEAEPDFSGADEAFKAWRAWIYALSYADLLESHADQMKESVIRNIRQGVQLGALELAAAEKKRTTLYHRVRRWMEEQAIDFLLLPVSQVPPFPVTEPYVSEIEGVAMESYIDWMKSCYYISAIGLPAISVPCGFTPEGLPVGVQIVGRHQDDWGVLQLAYAFEQVTQMGRRRPPLVEG